VNLAQRVESQGWGGCVLGAPSTHQGLHTRFGGFAFAPVQLKGKTERVPIVSVRTLETPRGIVANIPGSLVSTSASMQAVIVKVKTRNERLRLMLEASGEPAVGDRVRFTSDLPERPGPQVVEGRVAASSPLLDSPMGRRLELDVERLDRELGHLLQVNGSLEATVSLEDIVR
jgi:hypothetical protein